MGQPWKKILRENCNKHLCAHHSDGDLKGLFVIPHPAQPQAHLTPGVVTKQCWVSQGKTPGLDA